LKIVSNLPNCRHPATICGRIAHENATFPRNCGENRANQAKGRQGIFTAQGDTPMNRFAVQTNATGPATMADFHSLGSFDPADANVGDMLFLAEDQALFTHLERTLTVVPAQTEPPSARTAPFVGDAPEMDWSIAPYVMADAALLTDRGEVAAQDLEAGQRILTRDKGFQTVLWVGHRIVSAEAMEADPGLRPVIIQAGALGPSLPSRAMTVPQSQRLLVEGPRTKLMFGQREVFVPAAHLVGYPGITVAPEATVTVVFILCAAHEVIWVDGIWTESHQSGTYAAHQIGSAQHADIEEIFGNQAPFSSARRTLRRHEADLLLA
jgi:hypothetical protein